MHHHTISDLNIGLVAIQGSDMIYPQTKDSVYRLFDIFLSRQNYARNGTGEKVQSFFMPAC
jgi:hypothetical protein